jgi:predicted GH43/DUF377 family glycosyl hydrolase
MIRNLFLLSFSFLLLLVGCSKNNTSINSPSNSSGSITLKIDTQSVPAGVTLVTASLSRTGYNTLRDELNLLSDSTADITMPAVPVGTWHLKVDAADINNTILYSGEADVQVQENVVVQVNLTLNPVSSGTGTISIFVTWGTKPSCNWIDFKNNPILTKNNNPSLPNCVSFGKVLLDNGLYKMWYVANYNNAKTSIWYAESQNGISWNTIGSEPVLTAGAINDWDSYGIIPSVVLKEYGLYKLYYFGYSSMTSQVSVGLATSTDGIHFTKYSSPVIPATDQYYQVGLTDIVKKDSTYYGYFGYNNSRTAQNCKIGVATSLNGINWTMYSGNPVISPSLAWEGGSIHCPSVIIENNKFKLVYGNTKAQDAFGMATSNDGFNFVKQSAPIFGVSNTVNNLVQTSYPYYRRFNDVSYLYYTGVDHMGNLYICMTRNFND